MPNPSPSSDSFPPTKIEKLLRQTVAELRDLRGDYQALLQTVSQMAQIQQETQQELKRLSQQLTPQANSDLSRASHAAPAIPAAAPAATPVSAKVSQPAKAFNSETEAAEVYWQRRNQAIQDYQPLALRTVGPAGSMKISLDIASPGQQLYYAFAMPKQRFAVMPDLERVFTPSLIHESGLEQLFLLRQYPSQQRGQILALTSPAIMIQEDGRWLLLQKGRITLTS